MLKVYLVRHAESTGNKKGINLGSDLDPSLSEKGKLQLPKLADYFKDKNISKIYFSGLKRTSETARILSETLNVPVKEDKNLRELKIGKWAGKKGVLEKWMHYYSKQKSKGIPRESIRPPGGENTWDHMKRVKKFLSSIKNITGSIIVVAHSGTNKVLLGTIESKDPDDFYSVEQDNACINELEFDGKNWKIIKVNFADY